MRGHFPADMGSSSSVSTTTGDCRLRVETASGEWWIFTPFKCEKWCMGRDGIAVDLYHAKRGVWVAHTYPEEHPLVEVSRSVDRYGHPVIHTRPAGEARQVEPREAAEILIRFGYDLPKELQPFRRAIERERSKIPEASSATLESKEAPAAGGGEPPKPETRRERKAKWLAEAMLLVRDHPGWPDAEIARRVDVNPSQLSRSPEYQAAATYARAERGEKNDLPRGHKSGGDLEAYADDEADTED